MNRFQYKAYSDHPWLVATGKKIFEEYLKTRNKKPPSRNIKKLERAFITTLTGLYLGGALIIDYRYSGGYECRTYSVPLN
jgi:hypothetical protein